MIDPGSKLPENRIHLFDPVGLINDKYANYGARPRPATSSYETLAGQTSGVGGGGLRLAVEPKVTDTGSGGSSPRLWNSNSNINSPPTSPKFTTSPTHQYPEPMSPNSRTQAIARGRRELMEMIKDIPESCYELSLRDIVERKPSPPLATVVQPSPQEVSKKVEAVEKKLPVVEAPNEKKGKENKKKTKKKVGKSESKKKMVKSKSVDNGGFLLRTTVFPIPFRSKKKKRSLSLAPSFKVAPNSTPKSSVKSSEKNWWGRKSRVSSEIESLSSSRSSSIVSRHIQTNRFLPSCCSFFNDKKMKAKK